MTESDAIQLARVQERIGVIAASADKAHSRIDDVAKEMKADIKLIAADVKILLGSMHKSEGSKSSMVYALSTLIAAVSLMAAVAKLFMK